ncbi:unnamed protein product [Ilex paraguariensis]|uniref:Uncharacterized protein n=1 Tax=Ilex paraguariensis TaxID=185542 RepID=A0ABC8SIZ1_9AQUA
MCQVESINQEKDLPEETNKAGEERDRNLVTNALRLVVVREDKEVSAVGMTRVEQLDSVVAMTKLADGPGEFKTSTKKLVRTNQNVTRGSPESCRRIVGDLQKMARRRSKRHRRMTKKSSKAS